MMIGNPNRLFAVLVLAAGVWGLSGCNGKTAKEPAESATAEAPAVDDTPVPAPAKASASRQSVEGKWILTLSQRGRDFGLAAVEILPEADATGADRLKVLQAGPALGEEVSVEGAEIDDKRVHLELMFGETEVDFQGYLVNGQVRGSILLGGSRCDPSVMIPTSDGMLGEFAEGPPSPGRAEFDAAVNSPTTFRALESFVKQQPSSPLALTAYVQLFSMAGQRELSEDAVRSLAKDYLDAAEKWGERMREMARVNVGIQLVGNGYLPEVGLEFLSEAEKNFTPETKEAWQALIDSGREEAKVAAARARANELSKQIAESDTPAPEALQELRDLSAEYPNDPLIAYSLGLSELKADDKEAALKTFARLGVLPQMELILQSQLSQAGTPPEELPSETAAKLWKEVHGSSEGYEEFLTKTYRDSLVSFADKQADASAAEKGNRVSLVELFTGAQCPPCVAADVATAGLEATYPHDEVIVIRYHQHIPGPDPLANPEGEARFSYYQGQGTPTVAINGARVEGNVGGFIIHSPMIYRELQGHLQEALSESSPIEIRMTAEANGADVKIDASVENLPEGTASTRLRFALVEDEISFVAANGIRQHEWIVRSMPGGAEGIGLSDGALKYQETISLAEVRAAIAGYLDAFETGTGSRFVVKPMEMKQLHLVGFVQDDDSGQILQAASVPVSGEINYPEGLPTGPATIGMPTPPRSTEESTASPADASQPANASQEDAETAPEKPTNSEPAPPPPQDVPASSPSNDKPSTPETPSESTSE